jgi:hypothetical protein
MDRRWVVSIRDQCRRAGVPFFFKQWGGVRKSRNGRELDGRTHDDLPTRDTTPAPASAHRLALLRDVERAVALSPGRALQG